MKIEHIGIWVSDLEKMKDFYTTFFDCIPYELHHNPNKNFKSYFLTFSTSARLELMHKPELQTNIESKLPH
jgi:lactoylglutathione lyase